jgi:serine phosphatase RsbU (regulator of sigma subunit)
MLRITVHEGQTPIADLQFEDELIYLGSRPGSSIHLPDPRVPEQQAVIAAEPNGDWTLASLRDDSRIYLRGKTLHDKTTLKDGDAIAVLQYRLRVSIEDSKNTAPAPPDAAKKKPDEHDLPISAVVKADDDEIRLTPARLTKLVRANNALSDCIDLRSLLDVTLTVLLQNFAARIAWVGIRRKIEGKLEFVEGRSSRGSVVDEPALAKQLRDFCLEHRQHVVIPQTEDKASPSALAVPLLGRNGAFGMLYVDSPPDARVYQSADLDLLTCVAAQVTAQLELIIDKQARTHAAAAAGQAELAQLVQSRLDPKAVPRWPGLHLAAYCKPGADGCSDVYDLMKPQNGMAVILLAKVQTHTTIESLLVMTEVRSAFRIACLHNDAPHLILREFNWMLHDPKEPRRIDVGVLQVNPKTGDLAYAMGGKVYAVVIDAAGEPRGLKPAGDPPVGTTKHHEYQLCEEKLGENETLASFTAGITSAANAAGEALSANQIVNALCDGFGQPAPKMMEELLAELADYLKHGTPPQDITLNLIHRDADLGVG